MRKNRNVFIVVIVLAIIAAIFILTTNTSTFKRSQSDFAVNDTSNITMIFMSDKNNNTLKMTRQLPGYNWIINDKYPGHKFNINMLLETMLNIQVKEPVPMAARNNMIRELSVNAVKVEIYQWVYRIDLFGIRLFPHEKLTKVYYVGGATQNNRGTFMLMQDSPDPFITYLPGLRGFVSPRYMPIEKYWRDYTVFKKKVDEIASVRVEFPAVPEQSFLIINKHDDNIELVSLIDNKKIINYDKFKILNFLSAFRNLNFEALLNDMDQNIKDSILSSQPFTVITLTDTKGISNTIKTFHKKSGYDETDYNGKPLAYDLDRAYALVNDGKDFTLIQFFVFDKILKPVNYFEKGYKEESRY
jgi:hypothetical protein